MNKDNWQDLFKNAWNLLTCGINKHPLDSMCLTDMSIERYLTEFNMVEIVCPRRVGKSTFIMDHYRNGDILLTQHRPERIKRTSRRDLIFQVRDDRFGLRIDKLRFKGLNPTPARYIFADEVHVTREVLSELVECKLIDKQTKIFSLRTPIKWDY
jgi:predicted AAA+ superfamily ATPase